MEKNLETTSEQSHVKALDDARSSLIYETTTLAIDVFLVVILAAVSVLVLLRPEGPAWTIIIPPILLVGIGIDGSIKAWKTIKRFCAYLEILHRRPF